MATDLFSHNESFEVETFVLPFVEWVDSEINVEKWDMSVGKDTKKGAKEVPQEKPQEPEKNYFEDDQQVLLPESIPVHEWKRLNEIYTNAEFVINTNSIDFIGLKNGSKNVLHSEFMRSFISSIGILEYLGNTGGWPVESINPNYTPNVKDSWKPWHHIYAVCKAGKGQTHAPKFNAAGKYIVRLFWMGSWRKIYVDDSLPVDSEKQILLPNYVYIQEPEKVEEVPKTPVSEKSGKDSAAKGKGKAKEATVKPKMVVEVWQYILCKALLKIASLSWNSDNELLDFNPIYCLTGWVFQKIYTTGMSRTDIWEICEAYTPKYVWEEEKGAKGGSKKGSVVESKASKGKKPPKELVDDGISPYSVIACCFDVGKLNDEEALKDVPATCSYDILIEQTRDIPIKKPPDTPELARWKRFRWIAWAIRKGIIPYVDPNEIRCLKLFSTLNKCPLVMPGAAKIGAAGKDSKSKDDGSSKSSKGQVKVFPPVDRSIWIDFINIEYSINCLYVFFKPYKFETKLKITDISNTPANAGQTDGKQKPQKKEQPKKGDLSELIWPSKISDSRNDPLYIFADSLDYKFVVINLSQMGNIDSLSNKLEPVTSVTSNSKSSSHQENKEIGQTFSYAVLENYNWQINEIGSINLVINTRGSKSIVVYLKPGRSVLRVWLRSDNYYILYLLSNTALIVGNLETVLECMNQESITLMKFTQDVSNNFGKLVQSFGTTLYAESLKEFCISCRPNKPVTKVESSLIDNLLLGQVIKCMLEIPEIQQNLFVLKVLFLNPSLGKPDLKNTVETIKEDKSGSVNLSEFYTSSTDVQEIKTLECAAIKIQSYFKYLFVKKLFALHDQTHKKYVEIYEILKKIYSNIFSASKRPICINLIRNFFFENTDLVDMNKYTLFNDLLSVVNIQYIIGTTSFTIHRWMLLTRRVFHCDDLKPTTIKICLFANLKKYLVRAFNNDTQKEIQRFTNNTCTITYENNKEGYTVLCYGWSNEANVAEWKLCLVTTKKSQPSLTIPDVIIDEKLFVGYFKPNVNNLICKYHVNVKQDTYATFRLLSSYDKASIELRCLNNENVIMNKISGIGSVILPFVKLKFTLTKTNILDASMSEGLGSDYIGSVSSKNLKSISSLKSETKSSSKVKASSTSKHRSSSKSIDRLSRRNSKKSSHRSSLSTYSERFETYTIEAIVNERSWPLSKKEWIIVRYARAKSLLYPKVTTSSELLNQSRHSVKEPSETSKLSGEINNPIWQLFVIYNEDDSTVVQKDNQRREEINNIKREWYNDNTSRHDRSIEVRNKYLESHSILDTSNDTTTVSSLLSNSTLMINWIPDADNLPPFELEPYMHEDVDEENRIIKDEKLEIKRQEMHDITTKAYDEKLQFYQQNISMMLMDQVENFVLIKQWYEDCRSDSTTAIKSSYLLRDQYIDFMIEESKANEPEPIPSGKDKKKK